MLPFLTMLTWLAATSAVPVNLTPSEAVSAALVRDPALAAREADIYAAEGLVRETRFPLQNPEVDASISTDGTRRTGSLMQPLAIKGQARYSARSARAQLESATAAGQREKFETAAATRRAYARAVVARELLRFSDDDRTLLARLRGVAEARLAAGEGIDLHVRLARLEETRAVAAWLEAQAEASAADVELAALIGVTPGELAHDPIVAGPAEMADEAPRSDVLAASKATEAARAALSRERAAALPFLGVGAFFEADDGRTIAGPAVTVTVPIWKKNQAGIGAARGNLRLAEAIEASIMAQAATEKARAEERLKVAEAAHAVLAPDIREEAEPALKAIEILFTSGEVNLPDTLLMRARVVEGKRAWLEAHAAVAIARIDVALARQSASLLP